MYEKLRRAFFRFNKIIKQKKFYIRIRVSQLAIIPTLFPDLWRSLNFKKGELFDCIEKEGVLKTLNVINKMPG